MILIFGGTTEGKRAAEILDFIAAPYFYSTKIKVTVELKGTAIHGAMEHQEIISFCENNAIRLIIDAAHPFANQLHQNIYAASIKSSIPVLRYEREDHRFQPWESVSFFDSYQHLSDAILKSKFKQILSLTGVNTIPVLKSVWKNRSCHFRILNTSLSLEKAQKSGIPMAYVIPMHPSGDIDELIALVKKTGAELLLSKDSGTSGFMEAKKEVSQRLNIPLWIVKRPTMPPFDYTVFSGKELLQHLYSLRKTVLRQEGVLRSGFTSGSCVTAAAKACFLALVNSTFPPSVVISLPGGEKTNFLIFEGILSEKKASCVVIKDGGDDPDVTHGKEIGCELTFTPKKGIRFLQGKGVGKVTLPGLSPAVGEPAINPVPRQMITNTLEELSLEYETESGFLVKPFVPEGEELARQTFNPRMGVIGGISIIGTSGKVSPYSNEAFLATIKYQLSVAKESGIDEVVFTSGKRSENTLRIGFPHLPDTAFIHFGNLVGESIKMAVSQGIKKINLGIMLGKAVKLGEGYLDTHSKRVHFNTAFLTAIAHHCAYAESIISQIEKLQIANALFAILPVAENKIFYQIIAKKCFEVCQSLIPEGYSFGFILLLGEGSDIYITG